jgi:hypothetical protein
MGIIYNRFLPEGIPGKVDECLLIRVYDTLDEIIVDGGNNVYDEIALWESCCISVMYKQNDRLKASQLYVDWFEQELEEIESVGLKRAYKILVEGKLNMDQLAELHGIYRHWGHPKVDESLGCEKERSIGTSRSDPIQ